MKTDVYIKIVKNWSSQDIVKLYKAGGWWKDYYDSSGIPSLIHGSFAFAVAVDKITNETIGMARVLSDSVSDAYIQDVVVLPGYRKAGVGKKLILKLIDFCKKRGILWIALISEPDQETFYKKLGFKHMKNYTPMKLED
jgi:GNAT superfamily N-acetyltransferase